MLINAVFSAGAPNARPYCCVGYWPIRPTARQPKKARLPVSPAARPPKKLLKSFLQSFFECGVVAEVGAAGGAATAVYEDVVGYAVDVELIA